VAKVKATYVCNACGTQLTKWAGQCPDCAAWNTIVESRPEPAKSGGRFGGFAGVAGQLGVQPLAEVAPDEVVRFPSGSDEFDRVLGGGLVPGSVVLLGGDPGIGKSTLLLQTSTRLARGSSCLYVTGEESPQQVSLRAHRLGLQAGEVRLLAETNVERIIEAATSERPRVLVVDSIQTIFTAELQSAPGSVAQVRESAAQLTRFAKASGTSLFLVGHVTKEGQLAGPRVLEHMVDTVLYFEGDPGSRFRVVRAFKNRYGAVNELAVFAMTDKGLKEISNPSAIFLSGHEEPVPGSVVMVTLEGSRPLLVEVQALVDESHLNNPRRVTLGLDQNRLAMLLAVLHRHGGVPTYDQDVFVNVVGGMRVAETGVDLAVLLAVLSSLRSRALPSGLVVFGEVGLAGEIRPVPNGIERLKDAAKHGFTRAVVPAANAPKRGAVAGLEVTPVKRLAEALAAL